MDRHHRITCYHMCAWGHVIRYMHLLDTIRVLPSLLYHKNDPSHRWCIQSLHAFSHKSQWHTVYSWPATAEMHMTLRCMVLAPLHPLHTLCLVDTHCTMPAPSAVGAAPPHSECTSHCALLMHCPPHTASALRCLSHTCDLQGSRHSRQRS